jgi:hypothetical protein
MDSMAKRAGKANNKAAPNRDRARFEGKVAELKVELEKSCRNRPSPVCRHRAFQWRPKPRCEIRRRGRRQAFDNAGLALHQAHAMRGLYLPRRVSVAGV